MQHLIQQFRAASVPFVTRALRGPRRRRLWLSSALCGLMVVLSGLWLALSPGDVAHDGRVSMGLETSRWDRQEREFTIFVDSEEEREQILEYSAVHSPGDGPMEWEQQRAWQLLDTATTAHSFAPRDMASLQERARTLRNARLDLAPGGIDGDPPEDRFDWDHQRQVERLRSIVAAELQPRLAVYTSPLTGADAIRVMGMIAGGLLTLMMMVFGPLWVAATLAQELHENTLQPLTGTALTSGQLVLGLVMGGLAPIAIIGTPLLTIHLGAAATAGRLLPAVGMTIMAAAMGAMLLGLAMLGATAVGRKRAPGLVVIGLLSVLGTTAVAGLGSGFNLHGRSVGLTTVLPATGPAHLLAESFFPANHLRMGDALWLDTLLLVATAGAVLLAFVITRGLSRRLGGTDRTGALRWHEAAAAGVTLALLASLAIPDTASLGEHLLLSLILALVPVQLVLMGRLAGGEVPPALRRLPVAARLGEHTAWLAALLVPAVILTDGPGHAGDGLPIGLIHLAWVLLVVPLVTIRATALPSSTLTKVWLVVCLGFAMLELATAGMWCMGSPRIEQILVLGQVSPVLGLVQLGMIVWIPLSLFRALSPRGPAASDAPAAESAAHGPPSAGA
ncbi:MAG: hypothetical protein K0V04_11320 [Deltaproteobacteria bacterium]|nr:hypothetical protein [Deltaproteobacteria bacterium]